MYDLPEWNLCDLDDLYILTGMRYDLLGMYDLQELCMKDLEDL